MRQTDMIDRAAQLLKLRKEVEAELEGLTASLTVGRKRGDMLQTSNNKLRVCSRDQLIPSLLEEAVSPAMWRRITERKPVAALYKAEQQRGKLDPAIIVASSEEVRKWLERR